MRCYSGENITFPLFSFGFADFDTVEKATLCQKELNEQMLDGSALSIGFALPLDGGGMCSRGRSRSADKGKPPSMRLLVRGIKYSTSQDTLEGVFRSADRVHIATFENTGKSRGYVFHFVVSSKSFC